MGHCGGTEMAITVFELNALSKADVGKRLRESGNLVGKVRLNHAGSLVVAFEYRFRWGGKVRSIALFTLVGRTHY